MKAETFAEVCTAWTMTHAYGVQLLAAKLADNEELLEELLYETAGCENVATLADVCYDYAIRKLNICDDEELAHQDDNICELQCVTIDHILDRLVAAQ